jgi:hypothetical protein
MDSPDVRGISGIGTAELVGQLADETTRRLHAFA